MHIHITLKAMKDQFSTCICLQTDYDILGARAGFLNTLGEGPIFPHGGAGIVLNRVMVRSLVATCKCWDKEWMAERCSFY